jgi:2-haloacid dehalogenase
MNYRWLFFDADDTLFDYPRAETGALEMTFFDMGLTYSPETLPAYQIFNQQVWREFEQGKISALDLRVARFARLFEHLNLAVDLDTFSQRYLVNLSRESVLIEGAANLLADLCGQYHMGLITNGLPEVQRPRLAGSGIAKFFDFVAISEEMGVAKPDPRFFSAALAMAGQPDPRSVLVIGDSLNSDIRGGIQAGLDTLWYNPSGKPGDPRWPVVHECRSLEEMGRLLLSAD